MERDVLYQAFQRFMQQEGPQIQQETAQAAPPAAPAPTSSGNQRDPLYSAFQRFFEQQGAQPAPTSTPIPSGGSSSHSQRRRMTVLEQFPAEEYLSTSKKFSKAKQIFRVQYVENLHFQFFPLYLCAFASPTYICIHCKGYIESCCKGGASMGCLDF